MPRKLRQLRQDLVANGAYIASQKGSHQKWKHPKVSTVIELAGNDGKDAKFYQEKDVAAFIRLIERTRDD